MYLFAGEAQALVVVPLRPLAEVDQRIVLKAVRVAFHVANKNNDAGATGACVTYQPITIAQGPDSSKYTRPSRRKMSRSTAGPALRLRVNALPYENTRIGDATISFCTF